MKDLIFEFIRPFLTAFAMIRFGSIWGLKQYLLKSGRHKFLELVYGHYFLRKGSFIGITSVMDGIPCFPHGVLGVFISNRAKLGKDVVIFQHVTIGSNTIPDSRHTGSPTIGNNVYIGAGAKIIGGITIGDNCRIGANAVVYEDMPPNSVAVSAPTRIIQKESLDNTYYTTLGGVEYYYKDSKLHKRNEA